MNVSPKTKTSFAMALALAVTSCGDGLPNPLDRKGQSKKKKEAEELCKKQGKEVSKKDMDAYLSGKTTRIKCKFSNSHMNGGE